MRGLRQLALAGLLAHAALVAAVEPAGRVTSDAQAATEQKLARATLRQAIDAAMLTAGRGDGSWAATVEQDVRTSLQAAIDAQSRVRELRCAANFCRLVIEHHDWHSQEALMEQIEGKPGFRLPGKAHLEVDAAGSAISYVYLRNPEVDWPSPTADHKG